MSGQKMPRLLGIPEKLHRFAQILLALRLPMERSFFLRDIMLSLVSLLLIFLTVLIGRLGNLLMPISLGALLLAFVPTGLRAFRIFCKKDIPLEEIAVTLAAISLFLLREYFAAVLVVALTTLLCQTEAYATLQRDAALESAREGFRRPVLENTLYGRIIASLGFWFYALLCAVAVISAIIALFRRPETVPFFRAAAILLGLAGPSAGIYSAGLVHFGAAFSASKENIFFREDETPSAYARCTVFAFSKTGTITDGDYAVSEVVPVGISEEELLKVAALAECRSQHPIAKTLRNAAGLPEGLAPEKLLNVEEIPGKGVSSFYDGSQIYVGNAEFLEEHGIWFQVPSRSGSAIHVAVDNTYRGYIMISDELREGAFEALEELRAAGAVSLVMLTGDVRSAAKTLASSLNFDLVKAGLSPKEKGSAVRYLRSSGGDKARIACVGDGVHDSEMFQESDISICFDAKEESDADLMIYSSDLFTLPSSLRICRKAKQILSIGWSVLAAEKLLLCILGLTSVISPALVLSLDPILGIAAVIYALSSFRLERRDAQTE